MRKKRNIAFQLCCLIAVLDALLLLLAIGLKEAGMLTPAVICYDLIVGQELTGDCLDVGWSIENHSLHFPVFVPLIAILAMGILGAWAARRIWSTPSP